MKIVIVGAGNAGRQLAIRLCSERHNVVLIDVSMEAIRLAESSLDAMSLCGSGVDPQILEQAGTEDADLFIAVTDRDEINILACLLANAVGVPRKIARVGSAQFVQPTSKFSLEKMGINLVINQKQACVDEICRALALQVPWNHSTCSAARRLWQVSPLPTAVPFSDLRLQHCRFRI